MAILTNYHFALRCGGTPNAMDSVDGNDLLDGDRCYVIEAGVFYTFWLDADNGGVDNSGTTKTIIAPDTNAGTKRWLKCTIA
jgi:hypothetical protein